MSKEHFEVEMRAKANPGWTKRCQLNRVDQPTFDSDYAAYNAIVNHIKTMGSSADGLGYRVVRVTEHEAEKQWALEVYNNVEGRFEWAVYPSTFNTFEAALERSRVMTQQSCLFYYRPALKHEAPAKVTREVL